MSPDKTKELIEKYPELFSNIHHQTCMQLFGFECDDGWFELLKECIEEIGKVCKRDELDIKAQQVKEKYGELRFYLSSSTDEIDNIVLKAEDKSIVTCEECGKEGKSREVYSDWYKTLCEECFNGRSSK